MHYLHSTMRRLPVTLVLQIFFLVFLIIICYGFFYLNARTTTGSTTSTGPSAIFTSYPREIIEFGSGRCIYDLYAKYKMPAKSEVFSWEGL